MDNTDPRSVQVNDYNEQIQFDDGLDGHDAGANYASGDIQASLLNAAQPLEYQATLEVKFASYDNYCSLFHYILNSDGPVDLEVPSVCRLLQRNLSVAS